MSRETLTWVNTNTLIGFTDKRGHAWHWRAEDHEDGTSNHYPRSDPDPDRGRAVPAVPLAGREPPLGG